MNTNPRGLKDLIKEHQVDDIKQADVVLDIDMTLIQTNKDQPRKFFDQEKIEELALSIKQHGVLQPIIVKEENNGYVIIAGERRYQACMHLNMKTIPALVRQYQNKKIPEISLIENIQRENLNPIEEAKAYQHIISSYNYKQHELALKVGKSRTHIVNILGLLKLPEDVLQLVEQQKLSMGHARAISKLSDQKAMREVARLTVSRNYSVRDLEQYISQLKDPSPKAKKELITNTDETLSNILSCKVTVDKKAIRLSGSEEALKDIYKYLSEFKKK
jgi:ParB family transcriptional regulator, chromosome partitioning protein